jgi:hypothetical protein
MSTGLRRFVAAVALIVGMTVIGRLAGYRFGRNTVARCRQGHLFTTIWIPGVKLKAVDLLVARFQHCPVGHHWSLVTPVRDRDLTDQQRRDAAAHHDVRLP